MTSSIYTDRGLTGAMLADFFRVREHAPVDTAHEAMARARKAMGPEGDVDGVLETWNRWAYRFAQHFDGREPLPTNAFNRVRFSMDLVKMLESRKLVVREGDGIKQFVGTASKWLENHHNVGMVTLNRKAMDKLQALHQAAPSVGGALFHSIVMNRSPVVTVDRAVRDFNVLPRHEWFWQEAARTYTVAMAAHSCQLPGDDRPTCFLTLNQACLFFNKVEQAYQELRKGVPEVRVPAMPTIREANDPFHDSIRLSARMAWTQRAMVALGQLDDGGYRFLPGMEPLQPPLVQADGVPVDTWIPDFDRTTCSPHDHPQIWDGLARELNHEFNVRLKTGLISGTPVDKAMGALEIWRKVTGLVVDTAWVRPSLYHGPIPTGDAKAVTDMNQFLRRHAQVIDLLITEGVINQRPDRRRVKKLSQASLRQMNLAGVDFINADLAGADFSDSVLVGADFDQANLAGADFTNALVDETLLDNATIGLAHLDGALMANVDPVTGRITEIRPVGQILSDAVPDMDKCRDSIEALKRATLAQPPL